MKRQSPTHAKNARKPSDAILAKRYLELQRLRDEVRKAEISGMIDAPYSRGPSGPHSVEFEKAASTRAGDLEH
jgi:hypothetical protein